MNGQVHEFADVGLTLDAILETNEHSILVSSDHHPTFVDEQPIHDDVLMEVSDPVVAFSIDESSTGQIDLA